MSKGLTECDAKKLLFAIIVRYVDDAEVELESGQFLFYSATFMYLRETTYYVRVARSFAAGH